MIRENLSKLLFVIMLISITTLQAQTKTEEYTEYVLDRMTSFYDQGIDEKLYLQFDKPYYSSGDKIWFKGYLRNAVTHAPLDISNFIYVDLVASDNDLVSRVKVRRDSTGFNGYITLDPEMESGDYTIRGYTRWMLNQDEDFIFSRAIKISSSIPDSAKADQADSTKRQMRRAEKEIEEQQNGAREYSVQFFPEGGALLADGSQVVAFKAVASDGLSIEVEGAIYNSREEEVTTFRSTHKGMGSVTLFTQGEEQYFAKVRSSEGLESIFELPTVESVGATIAAREVGGKLFIQAKATPLSLVEGAHLVIHSHGLVVSVSELNQSLRGSVDMEALLEGVNVISLIDAQGEVLSQRLVFKHSDSSPQYEISTDRANYARRERVNLKINIQDSFGKAAQGEFGISVTDNSSVHFDPESDNIRSYLLLTSDLCGYIESPNLYFLESDAQTNHKVDLLMLTQGWRRFSMDRILAEQSDEKRFEYELAGEISGDVKGFFGNQARQPKLDVLCADRNYFDTFTLDESSTFKLVGLDIPDSTTYIIQSRTRKGGNQVVLEIDSEYFPAAKALPEPRGEMAYIPTAFVSQSQEKFYYEGGMNTIDIDAVYVTASQKTNSGSNFSTRSTNREFLEALPSMSLSTIIQGYPSMTITTDGVYYRDNTEMARFIVNGMDMEYLDVSFMRTDEVERIDFYVGPQAMMYPNSDGGVFVIELLEAVSSITAPGIAYVSPLGYQKPDYLYQPHYEVAEDRASRTPDFRTTIFWDGALKPDEEGNIEVEFYTADKATTYKVTLEGMTQEGEICTLSETISRSAER
ncbi:MAG: hypothetical protein SNH73_02100 [Rikenellaceae bacterium]